ncbi:MAG: polyribonucleotide nucleotidyltransferase [Phycisphaerae bacterium]|nr:polyribonucleotide nucleotidyltransferase [Phycisphaerae bacterium]
MPVFRVEREIAGRTLSIETGRLARQSHGSAVVRYGDTVVLSAVVFSAPREMLDFFPLWVDYREKTYAAGKFPGGFIKREGRPTNKEILTMRMIDRPIRPLFPKFYRDEVQIQAMVLSADQQNDPDILAAIASSAALAVSPIPFEGPIGAVRIGRVKDELVVNPLHSQSEFSSLELVLAGRKDAVNMIELGAEPTSEEVVLQAIEMGHGVITTICEMIEELVAQVNPVKIEAPGAPEHYEAILNALREKYTGALVEAKQIKGKQERNAAVDAVKEKAFEELAPEDNPEAETLKKIASMAFEEFEEAVVRRQIIEGRRSDGRQAEELREITCEVGTLPRTHGSAVFTRGETQALVVATLGTTEDEQIVDGLAEEYSKKFMLDYNFPPFSVGEVKPIRGPGRREIGHGALAERCLANVMPSVEDFPYTVRLVSDILESNGSSSMASTCGGTLALMDAGVPIREPVAGISIGLVKEGDTELLLTDIIGEEDHFGDMDFKVAGTKSGITGIQLDLKMRGIPMHLIRGTFDRAKQTRMRILDIMLATIDQPRPEISEYAPKLLTIKIDPEKIGTVIGPGGKMIRKIQDETGANIEIEDDGTVYISSRGGDGAYKAREMVEQLTEEIEVGKTYTGKVVSIKDFGAFIEVLPGQDGLCHISELADGYVGSVTDVVSIGDTVTVKVIGIDDQGRVKLSKRAIDSPGSEQMAPAGGGGRDRGGDRGGRGGDRGGRGGDRGGRGGDRGGRGGDRGGRR